MKEFVTAVKEVVEEDGDVLQFSVDGFEVTAHPPKDGQLAMLMYSLGRHTSIPTKMAGIIDFFVGIMDERSADHIANRLLDREDPYGIEDVEHIVEWMIEEWGGRPTQRPSASSPSRKAAGRK